MVVVVDPRLSAIEVWRRCPFCAAVFAFSSAPAARFDEQVVWFTGQGEVVDTGESAVGPIPFGVVNLTPVAGHGVPGVGTPSAFGMTVLVVY